MAVTRAGVVLLLLVGCTREPPAAGLGRRRAEGDVLALRASSDGEYLAYLKNCLTVKDRTLPAGTATCELWLASSQGDLARRIAEGVTTLPYGFAWSGRGHALAALAAYDPVEGSGRLVLWAGGEPERLAEGVTFYAFDGAGTRLGFVAGGRLFLASVGEGPVAVEGAEGIATFEFGRGTPELELLARQSARKGGELWAVQGRAVRPVAASVRDYAFARDGARFAFTSGLAQALAVAPAATLRPTPPLGRDVQTFLFSPRGDAIAYLADAVPGRQGDLWVAPLGSGAPRRLAERVGEPRWCRDGSRLAWLADYDPRSRTGRLGVGALSGESFSLAKNVSDFDLTPDGAAVAYLVHETAGGYSVDLGLARPGADGPPEKLAKGVFGFSFSPDGKWLYWRTHCVREAEACDLARLSLTAGTSAANPERVADGVKSYEFAPGRPDRLLIGYSRKDRIALDLAIWEGGRLKAVDTLVLPGSAQFLGKNPTRLGYALVDPRRRGVYVAEVP
ncbi:MAG TPA: hypothetical protein VLV17_02125 [Anaeromyxobacteraceae bacterium]|nr:hypothetical protein [Anaeromyxobacteraceae bacterium]